MVNIITQIVFITDCIFTGLKFIVPVLFLFAVFNFPLKYFNRETAITAACFLLLAANLMFIGTLASNIYAAWFTQNEAEKAVFLSIATGPNWYQLFIPVFNYGLLPAILWFKSMRKSVYPVFNIIMFWFISFYLMDYFTRQDIGGRLPHQGIDVNEYVMKTAVCLGLFAVIYALTGFRKARVTKQQ